MRTELQVHGENASNRALNQPNRAISGAGRRSNKPVHAAVSRIAPENRECGGLGGGAEWIRDRIDLRSDQGRIEVGNGAHAPRVLRGYRGDGAGAEDGERGEGLEIRLDSRASAGIRAGDGERNSDHGAWKAYHKS
jgi:hypothetical protein